ncbi:NTE family protein [Sphingomonas gellani]|uniref:NTE family protein n=1 Tax=Sphingomonas gellani TaxID=1166340 RepID=A0A1H8I9U4_9SPHN|nr:patatin-like phospholipase family protein [Sphingomonas gellani]SEN64905.1 NTE family protein [Sphingomonas gellani]
MSASFPNPLNDADGDDALDDGEALCLSGGGYRAMLFHLGVLWRLEQAGVLARVKRVSSVSGGSITAARLALVWGEVRPGSPGALDRLVDRVVGPVRALAGRTLDADAIVGGILLPGSIGDRVAAAYRKALFGDATLQDLPDAPRFVINATNVQSGVLWRFSKPYMGDYRVGRVMNPDLSLATAVAASSAFPPVLSPIEIDLPAGAVAPDPKADLQREPFTTRVVLADGGVYDNMGLETAWKHYRTLYVSDGGARMRAEEEPKRDWPRHAYRVLDLIDNQVRALRKRSVIAAFTADPASPGARRGAYWGIGTPVERYAAHSARLPCPADAVAELAAVPTRLKRLDDRTQERLVNWGYAVSDAALRTHVDAALPDPAGFPYPASRV